MQKHTKKLLVLLMAMVLMFGALAMTASAASKSFDIKESGDFTLESGYTLKKSVLSYDFKNTTNSVANVTVDIKLGNATAYDNVPRVYIGGEQMSSSKTAYTYEAAFAPGESISEFIKLDSTMKLSSYTVNITAKVTLDAGSAGDDGEESGGLIIGGSSKDKAVSLPTNQKMSSLFTGFEGSSCYYHYYKIEVPDDSMVGIEISNPDFYIFLREIDEDTSLVRQYGGIEETKVEDGGTYLIIVEAPAKSSSKGSYSIKATVRDFIPTTGFKVETSKSSIPHNYKGKITFTVTTVPANSDDKFIAYGGNYKYSNNGNTIKCTETLSGGTLSTNFIGNKVWFTLETKEGKKAEVKLKVKPATPALKKTSITATDSYVKVEANGGGVLGVGDYFQVQIKSSSRKTWSTVGNAKVNKLITKKGLKPLTKYDLRIRSYEDGVYGDWSKTVTIRTGSSVKPVISSIKFSSIKVTKKTVTEPGYWTASGKWYPPRKVTLKNTSATVKVTLKNKISGVTGLVMDCGNNNGTVYLTSKDGGKTWTGKITWSGDLKGKTVSATVRSYISKEYKGYGPKSSTKKVTIK